jgi:hypothetical protein
MSNISRPPGRKTAVLRPSTPDAGNRKEIVALLHQLRLLSSVEKIAISVFTINQLAKDQRPRPIFLTTATELILRANKMVIAGI